MARPDTKVLGWRSTSTSRSPVSGSTLTVLVEDSVGSATPITPVTAKGLKSAMPSGKSPNPLPKKKAGVSVLKVSAPTLVSPRASHFGAETD